jgi:heme-degrading monooxygenase HmoA
MSASSFAATPEPPYYAAIFTSQRTVGDHGYGEAADRMMELAAQQAGYLGAESARDASGLGITVSYWSSLEAIKLWKANSEHLEVQREGKRSWYSHFELRISKVERAYRFDQ